MISLLTLTNNFVYKFLKKQLKIENKVVPSKGANDSFDWVQAINGTSISKQVIELRTRFLIAIGEDEKIPENEEIENKGTKGTNEKTDMERFKKFLLENSDKNGKLPAEKLIDESLNLSRKQQQNLKTKLLEEGFLYKNEGGHYRLNVKVEV
jgi:hypothetical protein